MREYVREASMARRRSPKDAEANGETDVIAALPLGQIALLPARSMP